MEFKFLRRPNSGKGALKIDKMGGFKIVLIFSNGVHWVVKEENLFIKEWG